MQINKYMQRGWHSLHIHSGDYTQSYTGIPSGSILSYKYPNTITQRYRDVISL